MQKRTEVIINLSDENAKKLGISKGFIDQKGTIIGEYTNGIKGHFINVLGKTVGIADKYNALTVAE